jgi:hypothetical protein
MEFIIPQKQGFGSQMRISICVMELREKGMKYLIRTSECTSHLKHKDHKFMDRRRVWEKTTRVFAGLERTAAEVKRSQILRDDRIRYLRGIVWLLGWPHRPSVRFLKGKILSSKGTKNMICLIFFDALRICVRLDETRARRSNALYC